MNIEKKIIEAQQEVRDIIDEAQKIERDGHNMPFVSQLSNIIIKLGHMVLNYQESELSNQIIIKHMREELRKVQS